MSEQLDKALIKQTKAQKMYNIAKAIFVIYLTVILTTIAVQDVIINIQSQDTLVKIHDAQVDNQVVTLQNHQLTRKYVRCLIETLQLPNGQRNSASFDSCNLNSIQSPNTDPNTSSTSPVVPITK
jgi:predicted ATP-dependent Lon-type protease